MAKAEIFHVVNNVSLDFESEGHKYLMRLLVENGLIILTDETGKEQYLFLSDKNTGYTGEHEEEPIEQKEEPIETKPKKKRKKKKK